jgi:hypothetical protein
LKGVIPSKCLYKADQWLLLSRAHAIDVLNLPSLLLKTNTNINVNMSLNKINTPNSAHIDVGTGVGAGIDDSYNIVASKRSPVLQLMSKVRASDEMYIACCMAVLGYIRGEGQGAPYATNVVEDFSGSSSFKSGATSVPSSNANAIGKEKEMNTHTDNSSTDVLLRSITYVNWSEGGKSPMLYDQTTFTAEVIKNAKKQGCLFFRKVKIKVNVNTNTNANTNTKQQSHITDTDINAFCLQWSKLVLGLNHQGGVGVETEAEEEDISGVKSINPPINVSRGKRRRENENVAEEYTTDSGKTNSISFIPPSKVVEEEQEHMKKK